VRWTVLLLVVFGAGPLAAADEYHHQNVILGERALGLAGACTALCAEPASAWHNPAGVAFVRGVNVSVQTGVYGLLGDSSAAGGGFDASDSGQFVAFPSMAAFVRQVGGERHRLGFAVLTPDFDFRTVHLTARDVSFVPSGATFDTYSLVQDDRDSTLWAGPTYGFRVHPRVGVGASLFLTWRNRDLITKLHGIRAGQIAESAQFDVSMSHLSLLLLLGVRVEPVDGLFLGATFRTPNLRLAGSAEVTLVSFNPEGRTRTPLVSAATQYRIPWRASFGIAFAREKRFAVAADLSVHGGTDPYLAIEDETLPRAVSEIAKRRVVNVNLGVEYYLARVLPVRLGFFTNFSAQADPRPEVQQAAVLGLNGSLGGQGRVPDLYGVTGGLGLELSGTVVSVGLSYLLGNGTTVLGSAVGDRSLRSLLVAVAGSFGF
jgi:hypothetical protein